MLFDPGLQPERTELAWRRTALALAVGALVAMRVLPAALGSAWWAVIGAAGVVVAIAVWSAAHRRARRLSAHLRRVEGAQGMPGGGLMALVAGSAVFAGGCGVLVVLVAYAG